jgi:NADH dehydrogenase
VAGGVLPYDKLVIAVGSGANDFGTPGVHEHCFMIDSRRKADAFNQEIRLRMVRCMTSGEQLQVAIVGGGAMGGAGGRAGSACGECHGLRSAWARPPSSASC